MDEQHPVLGIDYGEARFGVACTDELGIIAYPLETIQVEQIDPAERISQLANEKNAKAIVLGLPIRLDGTEGTAAKKIRKFAQKLKPLISIPLHFQDETFTTVSAADKLHQAGKNAKKQKQIIDQAAAVEILNQWMSNTTFKK